MRPVLLDINGFASYRTAMSVDFRDADFFVLVGPTGSGKSTIIDAMVFALYGTVPRWDDRSAVAPALAPTANRAVVQLIFDVGGKRYAAVRDIRRGGGKTQSVTVKEARLEQYLSPDATGADGEETVSLASGSPKVTKAVESLLGLTFEQFTQSVALPQGEFARFLHATDGDRQLILKDLLGFGIYDKIGQAANIRAKDNTLRADTLAEQLAGYADATSQNVAALTAALSELGDFQRQLTTVAVPALTAAANEALAAWALVDQLSSERTELLAVVVPTGLGDLHTEQQAKKAALMLAETEQTRIEEVDSSARTKLQAATPRHELEQTQQNWVELDRIATDLPALVEAAAAASCGLRSATENRDSADAALGKARTASADADRAAELHQRNVSEAQTGLDTLNAVVVPAGLDAISQVIHDTNAQLAQANTALADAEAAQESAADELDAAPDPAAMASAVSEAQQLTSILAEDAARASQRRETAALAEQAQADAAHAATAAAAAERTQHDAERADAAAVIRSELHVGDNCLVCGQLVTALPPSAGGGDVSGAHTALRDARAAADAAAAAATRLNSQHSSENAVHTEQLRQCDLLRDKLVNDLAAIGMNDRVPSLQLVLGADTTVDALAGLAAAAASVQTDLNTAQRDRAALEEKRRAANLAVTAARATVRTAGQAATLAQDQAVSARAALRDARDTVSALAPPVIDDADVQAAWHQLTEWIQVRAAALAEELVVLSATAEDAMTAAAQLRAELALADAAATGAVDRLTAAALTKQGADDRLQTAQLRHGELTGLLSGLPELDEVRKRLEHVIALQQAVDAAGVALTDARAATSAAREALAGVDAAIETSWQLLRRIRDPLTRFGAPEIAGTDLAAGWQVIADWSAAEAASRLVAAQAAEGQAAEADTRVGAAERALIDALTGHGISVPAELTGKTLGTQALTLIASAVATAAAALTRAQERLRESEGMQAQMKKATEDAEVAKALANLMRSNQFPRWLIASALDTLLDDASAILMELSGGQFELTRDERDLLVIDHNDADMSRLVKTLSGGETFQASLALALALSKQVTSLSATGASKLESIFLDEGFGTLDETTLDVVASTLENLASSGSRMVGVITHVAALAERIPVRYEVIRDSAGSHIERQQL
jgi:DNA repair protein SbcC/Rad50